MKDEDLRESLEEAEDFLDSAKVIIYYLLDEGHTEHTKEEIRGAIEDAKNAVNYLNSAFLAATRLEKKNRQPERGDPGFPKRGEE